MKVTYTADDGTTFSAEQDCRAYENVLQKVKPLYDFSVVEMDNDSDGVDLLGFHVGFLKYLKQIGFGDVQTLMRHREDFHRLSDLLRPGK